VILHRRRSSRELISDAPCISARVGWSWDPRQIWRPVLRSPENLPDGYNVIGNHSPPNALVRIVIQLLEYNMR